MHVDMRYICKICACHYYYLLHRSRTVNWTTQPKWNELNWNHRKFARLIYWNSLIFLAHRRPNVWSTFLVQLKFRIKYRLSFQTIFRFEKKILLYIFRFYLSVAGGRVWYMTQDERVGCSEIWTFRRDEIWDGYMLFKSRVMIVNRLNLTIVLFAFDEWEKKE